MSSASIRNSLEFFVLLNCVLWCRGLAAHLSQNFQATLASHRQNVVDKVVISFWECGGTQTVFIQGEWLNETRKSITYQQARSSITAIISVSFLVLPPVVRSLANPQLYSLNSFSVWRQWRPSCIWIPDAFSGLSSACVWKGDYNLLLTTSLPHWRADKFWPWNWMWRHQNGESLLFTRKYVSLPRKWLSDRMNWADLTGTPDSQLYCFLMSLFLSHFIQQN